MIQGSRLVLPVNKQESVRRVVERIQRAAPPDDYEV